MKVSTLQFPMNQVPFEGAEGPEKIRQLKLGIISNIPEHSMKEYSGSAKAN
jgi:hypothetical protein